MTIRKFIKYLAYTILSFIGLIVLYLSFALGLASLSTDRETGSKEEVAIFIRTNGVHTDIVVPVKNEQIDWSKEVKFQHTKSGDSTLPYLAMGWGDKGFYMETPSWADLKVSTAFKAAFALGSAAMHINFCDTLEEDASCRKILISQEQYSRLANYLLESFRKDREGHVINIKTDAHYGRTDAFYEGTGSYSLFYTCNTWANNSLKTCGQKACWWTPFDKGIFWHYDLMENK